MTRGSSNPPGSGLPSSRAGAQVATPVPAGLIGRYQILDKIGDGGMGSLFLARDPAIDRLVAIKVLRNGLDTEALRERFAREARAAGRLRHPNIVTIFDVGEDGGDPFIAMEFLAGETLAELIRDGARLSLSRRLKLLEELCDGLAYAHRAGLVHRDIKPANLMVDAEGVLKILDFGIVRVSDSGMTQAGVLVGTVNYMSPEQVVGAPVDHRSDIFAVGLVAYELISGRQAFAGTMKEGLLHKILHEPAEPLWGAVPGLDVEVASIVDLALQKDPSDRYQDLVRMRNDLARARVRIEREEERTAAMAAADAGETAVIAEHATTPPERPPASVLVDDAERALSAGNFRAALTLAGRSAALNPQDRGASSIAARAEAALLERGRLLESGTPPSQPLTPKSGVPAPLAPSAPSSVERGRRGGLWIAVPAVLLAAAVVGAALWFRSPGTAPAPIASGVPGVASGAPAPAAATPAVPAPTVPQPVAPQPSESRGGEAPQALPAGRSTGSRGAEGPVTARGSSVPERRAGPEAQGPRPAPGTPPVVLGAPPSASPPITPSGPPPVERPAPPLRVGEDVSAPRLTRYVPPAYPSELQSAGVEGTVDIELTIGQEGQVTDARVVRSVRGLDEPALAAARQWQFAATRRDGEAVSLIHTVSVPFKLPEPARAPAPPAAPPAPPAPAPPTKPADAGRGTTSSGGAREEIEGALARYKAAWESLDPAALGRVQALSASEAADVRRFMATANRYQLGLEVQSVTVEPSGRTAVAQVIMTRRFDPKIGRAPATQRATNQVQFEKRGDAWLITSIR
jgi:serine/threonine-protein kinase